MAIISLPVEIIERIFLHLDEQALTACTVTHPRFAEIVYSNHFLDEYCRTCFGCHVLNIVDINSASIVEPFEFWYMVYTTMKVEETCQSSLIFSSESLTKLGTLKHMYNMWLVSGMRPSLLYAHLLMYEFYPLPLQVQNTLYALDSSFPPLVNNTLVKVFIALPKIMELSCSSLEYFTMQLGGTTSSHMDIVCNDGIRPRLPYNFIPLFSVEIISSPLFGKSPALLILVSEDSWILWIGYLSIAFNQNASITDTILCQYFNHTEKINEIRRKAEFAVQEVTAFLYGIREGVPSPIISYNNPDIVSLTISLTQQYHRCLQQKFDLVLDKTCAKLVSTITSNFCFETEAKERIIGILNGKVSQNTQINTYILNLLKIETKKVRKLNLHQHLSCLLYKSILEQVACLFRDCILQGNSNSFCHSVLCGCLGYVSTAISSDIEEKLEKCMSEKLKDILYSPLMWPSHVLSAACRIIPALSDVLRSDLQMITSRGTKYVIPSSVQAQITHNLLKVGLCLTNRPPTKPRCPPLLKQVRLCNFDHI